MRTAGVKAVQAYEVPEAFTRDCIVLLEQCVTYETDAQTTALSVTWLILEHIKAFSFCWEEFLHLCETILAQRPDESTISRLVDLLAAIASLPRATNSTNCVILFDAHHPIADTDDRHAILPGAALAIHGETLWSELPGLRTFVDAAKDNFPDNYAPGPGFDPAFRLFHAHLAARFAAHPAAPAWLRDAYLDILHRALEGPLDHGVHAKPHKDCAFVPSATRLLRLMAARVYALHGDDDVGDRLFTLAEVGYSRNRWAFWKQRLEKIGRSSRGASEEVRRAAREGAAVMEEIEGFASDSTVGEAGEVSNW